MQLILVVHLLTQNNTDNYAKQKARIMKLAIEQHLHAKKAPLLTYELDYMKNAVCFWKKIDIKLSLSIKKINIFCSHLFLNFWPSGI